MVAELSVHLPADQVVLGFVVNRGGIWGGVGVIAK